MKLTVRFEGGSLDGTQEFDLDEFEAKLRRGLSPEDLIHFGAASAAYRAASERGVGAQFETRAPATLQRIIDAEGDTSIPATRYWYEVTAFVNAAESVRVTCRPVPEPVTR